MVYINLSYILLQKSLISNGNSKAVALQTQTPQTARQRVTQSALPRKLEVSPSTPGSKGAGEVVPFYGGVAQPSTYSLITFRGRV